jgi:hypothetical protein
MDPPPALALETETERRITADPEWQAGVRWGKPRPGHPEGTVRAHIKVDRTRPRTGDNEHGRIAAAFAARYIDDRGVLTVIARHDDAYRAWRSNANNANEDRAKQLIADLEQHLDLYIAFYRCDTYTGDKTDADLHWFTTLVQRVQRGL